MTTNLETEIVTEHDRPLVAAWMLPREGPLTDTQRADAMRNLAAYLERWGITPEDAAHQVGRPRPQTIRRCLAGNSTDADDDAVRRLNYWIEQDARRRRNKVADGFVDTGVAKTMLAVARGTIADGAMSLVYGPSGIGKTRVCMEIAERFFGTVHLSVMQTTRMTRPLFKAIASKLGVMGGFQFGSKMSRAERIVESLRDSGRLLLIDEAAKCDESAIEAIRDLHDHCGNLPVMLVATKSLRDRIASDAQADGGQVYSRFGHVVELSCRFTLAEIRALFVGGLIRLSRDAEHELQRIAQEPGYGSLRRCRMLLADAARRARKRQGIDADAAVTVSATDLSWVEMYLRDGLTIARRTARAG